MVRTLGQHPRDYPALIGDAQAALGAELFNVDVLRHVRSGMK
jgi:hypothetical protein